MATSRDISDASFPQLISGLVGDVKDMAAGHATKMRGEVKDELKGLKQYLVKVIAGVGVAVLGAILLAHAFALGLDALGLPQWVAYLLAAAMAIVGGLILLKRLPGDNKDIDLVPETAIRDLKRDVRELKEDIKDEVKGDGHAHVH